MTLLRAIALAALVSFVAGCISHRTRQHIYALDAAVDAPSTAEAAAGGAELQLQRVLVPDYLDTTDLLLRVGKHEIRDSPTGRFGERLSLGITHALRSDLTVRLPLENITLAQPADRMARQILVTIDVFDVWQDGRCVLTANWYIQDPNRRDVLAAERGTFVTTPAIGGVANDAAIVSAMADAVRQLAERLASTIQSLPP
jgi:uncharacterized lipoprotein YmbA